MLVVDNSAFLPSRLTIPLAPLTLPFKSSACSSFQVARIVWPFMCSCSCVCSSSCFPWHGLLAFLCFIMAWHTQRQGQCTPWYAVCSSPAPHWIVRPVASPPPFQRLRVRRLCRCGPGASSKAGVERAIRIDTQGFACPNQQCLYFGITDADIHALVGDGKHGHAEQIQTFRCQACHTTFSARRDTPLYRLKTPSHQIAMVLSRLSEGLDPSEAPRVFGHRQATITSLSDSRWETCTDLARAVLLPSAAPTPPIG